MLNELCKLHSKVAEDQWLKIILTDDCHVLCDKEDDVMKSGNCFRITRPNGKIVSVNSSMVLMARIVNKERLLL